MAFNGVKRVRGITAYCGPKGNTALIPTERAATCRAAGPANNPLVAVCAQMAP